MNAIEQTLRGWAGQEVIAGPRARRAALGVAFVVATALGAYVWVPLPFTPVPITLQPLFVILAGAVLGPRAGAAAMATYVAVGAAGAPVFSAGNAGLPWLMGPTGGYLLAYPAAAFATGTLAGRRPGGLRLFAALAAGVALLYAGGVSQLWILTRQDPATLLLQGVVPFLPGDLLKVAAAWAGVRGLRSTSLLRP